MFSFISMQRRPFYRSCINKLLKSEGRVDKDLTRPLYYLPHIIPNIVAVLIFFRN